MNLKQVQKQIAAGIQRKWPSTTMEHYERKLAEIERREFDKTIRRGKKGTYHHP